LYWSSEKADAELCEVHIVVSLAKRTAREMPKIAEHKGDVLRFLLRSRNVSVSGTRAELA